MQRPRLMTPSLPQKGGKLNSNLNVLMDINQMWMIRLASRLQECQDQYQCRMSKSKWTQNQAITLPFLPIQTSFPFSTNQMQIQKQLAVSLSRGLRREALGQQRNLHPTKNIRSQITSGSSRYLSRVIPLWPDDPGESGPQYWKLLLVVNVKLTRPHD